MERYAIYELSISVGGWQRRLDWTSSLTSEPPLIQYVAVFQKPSLDIIANSRIYSVKWDVKAIVKLHKSHYSSALSIVSTLQLFLKGFPSCCVPEPF